MPDDAHRGASSKRWYARTAARDQATAEVVIATAGAAAPGERGQQLRSCIYSTRRRL